jgi:hypothetical protein
MAAPPVHVSTLPPFTNMRARCARCGSGPPIRVHFDRGCAEVVGGAHFHRICNCGHRWVEQCIDAPGVTGTQTPAR